MVTSPWLWPLSDVRCKTQTRPLVREDALHEEASTCQTKERVKSDHGLQRAARNQGVLADWPSVANSTPLQKSSFPVVTQTRKDTERRRRNAVEDSSERVHERIQEAASANLFPVIVICCGCNLSWLSSERMNPVPIRIHVLQFTYHPPPPGTWQYV
jgi:hypothetical protein